MVDSEVPLYGLDPGWLKTCTNFRVMPGGYLEARLGFEPIKPSGGTASDPIAAGIFTGAHEHSMSDGYIWTRDDSGGTYSANLAQRGYAELFPTTTAVEDSIEIFSDQKFSRVVFYIGQGTYGATNPVLAFEYYTASDSSTASALTTSSTPDFESTGEQVLEFADPGSGWVRSVRNGVYGYGIRIRVATLNDGVATAVRQSTQKIYGDWTGTRQIYVTGANAAAATDNGVMKYYGQSSATQVAWNSVSTALFSGGYARNRFASYRNILYLVNGKDQKRWDNNTLDDIGFDTPTTSGATVDVSGAGNLTGLFAYSITYGFGPAGEWGESNELDLGDTGAIASKQAVWTLNLTSIPAQAEKIYVYRSTDLTSVPTSATDSFPRFRITTLSRLSTGSFATTFTDNTLAFPFPPVELDIATRTPPTRCRFITTHKNRLFIGGNNQYPGRVWWSYPFEAEAFNQDEQFADFTRSTGGQLTGMVEFKDQVVCFTEDKMFGVANVDQDVPSVYEIENVGCIAPDSIQAGFGVLCWMGRNGIYVWDGNEPPKRVSDRMSFYFGKMSFEKHGGSRCMLHNRLYDIHLIDAANNEATAPRFRYDLVTGTWAEVSLGTSAKWSPLALVTAPVGHANAGVRHPFYGQAALTASDFTAFLGEYSTQDDGNNYTATATAHFGPAGNMEIVLDKVFAHYKGATGWGTPVLANTSSASAIGSLAGAVTNLTNDPGLDYNRIAAIPTEGTLGTADLDIRIQVTSESGGTTGAKVLSLGIVADGVSPDWGKS